MQTCSRTSTPKIAIVIASGEPGCRKKTVSKILGCCEPEADPICTVPAALDQTIVEFQKEFPMRYIVGIGDCEIVILCLAQ